MATPKSREQQNSEASVDVFRQFLGPFVVAAETTRMPMAFTGTQPHHPVIFANDAFLKLTGYDRDEVLAKSFDSLIASGIGARSMKALDASFNGAGDSEPEIHYQRKDGSEFWATLFVMPVCDGGGAVVQHFVSLTDRTEHRQDSARSKLLIDELNHRVKNTLSTVQSIVYQALRAPAEHGVIREAIESRIQALSRSHDLLTSSQWTGAGLHDLVDRSMQPFEVVPAISERLTVRGSNIRLPPKTTLALAIALNELATNAVKYGALSNNDGAVAIRWKIQSGLAGQRLVLEWRESNGPLVPQARVKGFGSWVIERGLAHELGGSVELHFPPEGVACTIDIPAPDEA